MRLLVLQLERLCVRPFFLQHPRLCCISSNDLRPTFMPSISSASPAIVSPAVWDSEVGGVAQMGPRRGGHIRNGRVYPEPTFALQYVAEETRLPRTCLRFAFTAGSTLPLTLGLWVRGFRGQLWRRGRQFLVGGWCVSQQSFKTPAQSFISVASLPRFAFLTSLATEWP